MQLRTTDQRHDLDGPGIEPEAWSHMERQLEHWDTAKVREVIADGFSKEPEHSVSDSERVDAHTELVQDADSVQHTEVPKRTIPKGWSEAEPVAEQEVRPVEEQPELRVESADELFDLIQVNLT